MLSVQGRCGWCRRSEMELWGALVSCSLEEVRSELKVKSHSGEMPKKSAVWRIYTSSLVGVPEYGLTPCHWPRKCGCPRW
jgi:hypothetical protein